MIFARFLLIIVILLISTAWLVFSGNWKKSQPHTASSTTEMPDATLKKLGEKVDAAREFVRSKGYNTDISFLVDMSLPSGQSRFFVYDLTGDSMQSAGLVTHGRCNEEWLEGRRYSNAVGGGCTSLGKYRIGHPYQGRFGLAYKLYGLEKTNDNAFRRYVVLHSHDCVPSSEVSDEICQSDGCPTVAPVYLQKLKKIIDASPKPVLLWIYD